MSQKEFIPYDQVRNNAITLAHSIYREGFVPDIIYVSLRGGAYMGNVISEFFKFVRRGKRPVFYAAVVARSYTDIHERDRVSVDGWTYSPEHLRNGDRVLLVDDIFDTGRTVNHLVQVILEKGIPRSDIKVAVHDYKIRRYAEERLPIQPDYYCRKHEIETPVDDRWIHYLSHELVGLESDEIDGQFSDVRTREILHGLP
ncbi:MAG: phosphoribosyltransferase [Spirochaetales bacterium]|nr:phosphoribosyltransferase [Spirochaetales bacterium]